MPTTSPDSLFYPDDSSTPDYAAHIRSLADSVQAKFTAQETWNSWTPTFSTGTDGGISVIGSGGHASGYYRRTSSGAGAFVFAEFRFFLGTSPTIVSGTFVLNLPVTAYNWGGATDACQNATLGSWILRDDSSSPVAHYAGTLGNFLNNSGTQAHFSGAGPGNNGADDRSRFRFDSNDPVTLAAGDQFTGQLFYRAN